MKLLRLIGLLFKTLDVCYFLQSVAENCLFQLLRSISAAKSFSLLAAWQRLCEGFY